MFVVWIDAAHGAGERVFGLTLLERHLKGLKHRKVQPGEVVIDLGAGADAEPQEAGTPLAVPGPRGAQRRDDRAAAGAGARSARRVLALDTQTLIDARLYDFVTAQPPRSRHRRTATRRWRGSPIPPRSHPMPPICAARWRRRCRG